MLFSYCALFLNEDFIYEINVFFLPTVDFLNYCRCILVLCAFLVNSRFKCLHLFYIEC